MCAHMPCRYMTCQVRTSITCDQILVCKSRREHIHIFVYVCVCVYKIMQTCVCCVCICVRKRTSHSPGECVRAFAATNDSSALFSRHSGSTRIDNGSRRRASALCVCFDHVCKRVNGHFSRLLCTKVFLYLSAAAILHVLHDAWGVILVIYTLHACIYVCMYTYTYICICINIDTHTYTRGQHTNGKRGRGVQSCGLYSRANMYQTLNIPWVPRQSFIRWIRVGKLHNYGVGTQLAIPTSAKKKTRSICISHRSETRG
jgi:hypothetical protein